MKLLLIGHGYVGSYLLSAMRKAGHDVVVCDQSAEALANVEPVIGCRYQVLTEDQLSGFDCILWFAGHSSVPQALADPDGAVANNCIDLLKLARLKPPRVRLIYASTSSVYSLPLQRDFRAVPPASGEDETLLNPLNAYDCSKMAFDALARCFAENIVGLRLGTVCGGSPRLRTELVFNAMCISAIDNGTVRVSNAGATRSLLFLDDLACAVIRLIEVPEALPPILNVGSFNISVADLAQAIANHHGARIIKGTASATYSFRMDCSRLHAIVGRPRDVSIDQRCKEFGAYYRAKTQRAAS